MCRCDRTFKPRLRWWSMFSLGMNRFPHNFHNGLPSCECVHIYHLHGLFEVLLLIQFFRTDTPRHARVSIAKRGQRSNIWFWATRTTGNKSLHCYTSVSTTDLYQVTPEESKLHHHFLTHCPNSLRLKPEVSSSRGLISEKRHLSFFLFLYPFDTGHQQISPPAYIVGFRGYMLKLYWWQVAGARELFVCTGVGNAAGLRWL